MSTDRTKVPVVFIIGRCRKIFSMIPDLHKACEKNCNDPGKQFKAASIRHDIL